MPSRCRNAGDARDFVEAFHDLEVVLLGLHWILRGYLKANLAVVVVGARHQCEDMPMGEVLKFAKPTVHFFDPRIELRELLGEIGVGKVFIVTVFQLVQEAPLITATASASGSRNKLRAIIRNAVSSIARISGPAQIKLGSRICARKPCDKDIVRLIAPMIDHEITGVYRVSGCFHKRRKQFQYLSIPALDLFQSLFQILRQADISSSEQS